MADKLRRLTQDDQIINYRQKRKQRYHLPSLSQSMLRVGSFSRQPIQVRKAKQIDDDWATSHFLERCHQAVEDRKAMPACRTCAKIRQRYRMSRTSQIRSMRCMSAVCPSFRAYLYRTTSPQCHLFEYAVGIGVCVALKSGTPNHPPTSQVN